MTAIIEWANVVIQLLGSRNPPLYLHDTPISTHFQITAHKHTNYQVQSKWKYKRMEMFDFKGVHVNEISVKTRRSENDNTPQPLDQWTNSPFVSQQVGYCKSFILTHYLADLFAMHHGPRSIPLCIQHHIQLTSLSFHVSRPSHS